MQNLITYLKKHKIKAIILVIALIWYALCLPKELFNNPTSTVITSSNNTLLGAKIAKDGQWRFPATDTIPEKFKICLLQFEDEYFYKHPGFNPISIFKAIQQNLKSNSIKRGGSTLTQQVVRLSRKNKPRTYFEKIKELILSTRVEVKYSKEVILKFYTNNAPFGGNVVGLEAASWRYFNRDSKNLSWAESATLAVLPNAPSLIFPGKNQERLLKKRNRLLKKLMEAELIDNLTYKLAIQETLPQKPYALPQIAPHLLQRLSLSNNGEQIQTTLDLRLQNQVNDLVKTHYNNLKQNEIYNAAVIVLDVKTRNVLAYIGNTPTTKQHQKDVDIITKGRSTGSVLKPFLYAAQIDAGELLPNMLIPDVPTQFGNYTPQNYNKTFDGAVPAKKALSRSLNIPSVKMLQDFGLDRFYHYLKALKLKDIDRNANHYGLTLILGGAESNLWDLTKSYAGFAGTINHYNEFSSQYYTKEFSEPNLFANYKVNFGDLTHSKTIFGAAATYLTFDSLKEVNRPEEDENWSFFDDSKQIAWKTGTSYGFKDAWAIGSTKDYIVGVWVGNADGEGRPGLVGVQAAAPLLFDVFDALPKSSWFSKPFDDMTEVSICKKSGSRATDLCNETVKEFIPTSGLKLAPCKYHKQIHLDQSGLYQVNSSCETLQNMTSTSWFELPALMAYYYKSKNPFYKDMPPFRNDCISESQPNMQFIYPKKNSVVYLPKGLDEVIKDLVLKVACNTPEKKLFWYIDNQYIKTTKSIHEIAIQPKKGTHLVTVIDEKGNEILREFEVSE
ncbi:penicillin-binding protein 1C [Aurantibacter sp.]|uniref:penicillin-binding protein 1C n=1 Tax=Aurantibacter sp. TaxID=2807103 RepID=UPI0035C7F81D